MFVEEEVLVAVNSDPGFSSSAWVTIDNALHRAGDTLSCVYSTDSRDIGQKLPVESRNGKAVHLTVPRAGFVICK